ncbi:MAG: glycosyltransferase family 39 protein, partial [Chloroflexi bacterium]|nr:glycosyltransferase family 39 protein [Chloroflexota bacterium]
MDISQEIGRAFSTARAFSAVRREALRLGLVASILALAVGLRFYGLGWDDGFPYTPHPDERAILSYVERISPPPLNDLGVLLDADESPWNPRWFPYGSFPLYLLKGVQLVYNALPEEELRDLRIAGRAVSALADVGTVLLVFLLGSVVYGRRAGMLAAALAAMAVLHIQLSHYFAVDTFLALFTVAAMYFMFRVAREGRLRDSALAGAFVGLGLATKVSQAPIYAPLVVAHVFFAFALLGAAPGTTFEQRASIAARGLAVGVATSLAVLFIAQPYMFLDWSRFYADISEQSEMVRRIRDYPYTRQYVDTTPYLYHVRQLATWGLGWPLGIVAWGGLLYASLRGMRWNVGLAYLAAGWALPAAMLIFSTSLFAIIVAAGVALIALLATIPFRAADTRADVLLLSWATPFFLITGAFEVKFMRYLIPLTPFLLLFGSRMMLALWDRAGASGYWPMLRPALVGGFALVIGFTGFYALSYMNVYGQTHTAVRASDWINANAPKGSLILKEHWEEGIPNLQGYEFDELPLYEPDNPQKTRRVAEMLASADYLFFFSNRLYATIPRLPERYPVSSAYYELLFSGRLGYELVEFEATYPQLLGVSFVDNTFDRQGLTEPDALRAFEPSPVSLDLGFADESFSVYDHPKVLVFQNVTRFDADSIRGIIESAAPRQSGAAFPSGTASLGVGLMLSPEQAARQQQGGTWTDIVNPDRWTARF